MKNHINDIIRERRSIYPREFSGKQLEERIVLTLLENANQAPNHHTNYPWRFIVIKGPALREWLNKAADLYILETPPEKFKEEKLNKILGNIKVISHAIAIVLHREQEAKSPEIEDISAVACAVQNMYLSLSQFEHAGGYWSTGLGTYSPQMHETLKLEANEKLMGYFIIGDVAEKRVEGHKKDYKKFVRYL